MYGEATGTAGTYRWSATESQYHYSWGSPRTGAGSSWRIAVRLDDGTTQTVNIGLR